jgi:hypothetical protein
MQYAYMHAGDNKPDLEITVTDSDGNQVLFTSGSTAVFEMTDPVTGTEYTNLGTCTITQTSSETTITLAWGATATANIGTYWGRFKVTYPGGAITHVPNDDYIVVRITE